MAFLTSFYLALHARLRFWQPTGFVHAPEDGGGHGPDVHPPGDCLGANAKKIPGRGTPGNLRRRLFFSGGHLLAVYRRQEMVFAHLAGDDDGGI
jgi:hypothetical protein